MRSKNVVINALSCLQGGGQVYLSNILRHARYCGGMKLYVIAPDQFASLYAFDGVEVIPTGTSSTSVLRRTLWERRRLPRLLKELKADLVFCPGGIISFPRPPGCRTAVTFQNMRIFDTHNRRRHPSAYVRCRLALLEMLSRDAFRRAGLVIFISQYAKAVVDRKVPRRDGLSIVVPHGLEERFRTPGRNDIPRLPSLPDGEYLLYVSYLDTIKAQVEVVQSYEILRRKRPTREKLLLVGPDRPPYGRRLRKEIERLGLGDRVMFIDHVPHSDMPSVYHHAKAHIFASTCENCPNVVIESLGSGRPLFLSSKASMPELAGDAAAYFNPYRPEELADLLLRHLDDEQWMNEMSRRAFERSLRYSWEKTAHETFEAFSKLLSAGRRKGPLPFLPQLAEPVSTANVKDRFRRSAEL